MAVAKFLRFSGETFVNFFRGGTATRDQEDAPELLLTKCLSSHECSALHNFHTTEEPLTESKANSNARYEVASATADLAFDPLLTQCLSSHECSAVSLFQTSCEKEPKLVEPNLHCTLQNRFVHKYNCGDIIIPETDATNSKSGSNAPQEVHIVNKIPLKETWGLQKDCSAAQKVERQVKSILNKLTREKFEKLYQQLLDVCDESNASTEFIEVVAREVFAKATTQHMLVEVYADVCARLHCDIKVHAGAEVRFKRALLGQCHRSFDQYLVPPRVDSCLPGDERLENYLKHKTKMLGNIRFIGHLMHQKMLSLAIVFHCTDELLSIGSPETLETLCVFLTTLGDRIDTPDGPYHAKLEEVFARVSTLAADHKQEKRTRCLLKDLQDLRSNHWQMTSRRGAVEQEENKEKRLRRRNEQPPEEGARPMRKKHPDSSRQAPEDLRPKPQRQHRAKEKEPDGASPEAKYTCRYLVGIEDDVEFHVCKRLIGPKGENMKHIVAHANKAKVRIRGRGSKYKEGADNIESSDPLMICVSATARPSYERATFLVEELLQTVQDEYRDYCESQGWKVPTLVVRREFART